MREERIELSQRERDRLKGLHEVQRRQLRQREAAERLGLSVRQVRRLLRRVKREGDGGVIHGLRGRPSNRKIPRAVRGRILAEVQRRYRDFGPTLASEHLARQGLGVSRETLRQWMIEAGLWSPRRQRVEAVHVWRERRAAFGELVMLDSSPFRWLEERGPKLQLIAMIDDATSRFQGRFVEHDSTEENLRTLEDWLRRCGRPVALYTDQNSLFYTTRHTALGEQLEGQPARTQFGRALGELGIEWIAAHSPQAKGRIERLFGTLQDRLVKEMRLAGVRTIEQANRFLSRRVRAVLGAALHGGPAPEPGCASAAAQGAPFGADPECARGPVCGQRLHRALAGTALGDPPSRSAARIARSAGRRRAAAGWQFVGTLPGWLSEPAPLPDGAGFGSKSFRPTASRTRCQTQEKNQIRPPSHSPLEEDTSTWQKRGHFYFALTLFRCRPEDETRY